ncbi:NAD(P)-binding domain-containing protein [Leptospira ilyithenensis]|uniref:4Fe-4S binding protein n=1 Tax=Leptospira ilyithenensis TaxID=2484901 RepID=A0A4V3JXD6_9LEPT|nr:NAD(P)-binding domain-containing protein [Leptospira ilyithenensis]TGN10431.1 4Fe-4S binding protein [Leptospira ilyithenensis]
MPFLSRYFTWLKKNAPEGQVEVYPTVLNDFSTNIPGIFIIGDLTGIPLLKFASHSGAKIWDFIPETKNELLDAVIIGAGPSGVSSALEAEKLEKKIVLLEAGKAFQTVHSYPKGKPIFAEPKDFKVGSSLPIFDGTKESLLDHLNSVLRSHSIPLLEGERVNSVIRNSVGFTVGTESGKKFHTNRVIIAMGKSGDPRRLGIQGEDLPHVSYRLIDPKDYSHKKVVIAGGGDSAVEAAISVSEFAESVTLVTRGKELTRPKQENIKKLESLSEKGKIQVLKESNLREIGESNVICATSFGAKKIPADDVLLLLGTTPPIPFLKKLGIRIQSSKSIRDWIGLISVFFFAMTAYFGKASFYGSGWFSPLASASAGVFLISSVLWLFFWTKSNGIRFPKGWQLFRNIYLIFASFYFLFVYFSATYGGYLLFEKYPSFHYTFLYSMTILVFGLRRITVKQTQYIKLQTFSLIFVQWFFLFLLPEIILPFLGKAGYLGAKDGFLLTQVFPGEAYWKAYGFILAWPLSMGVLYDGGITNFWLIYGLAFSFGVIPFLVYHYGKGAYCGWICSCGGLAETLGDEQREKMPHGKWAYRLEHSGQWILLVASIITLLKLIGVYGKSIIPNLINAEYVADSVKWIYDLVVDIGLAGVVGVGFYFFFSGRIWCRMFCPLAGLMHIYARFSKFRIFSEKKKCISCNICTKVCHQGIDVMSYANIGRPMDSVQCVRCSACVSSCPTQVLSFGKQNIFDQSFDKVSATL